MQDTTHPPYTRAQRTTVTLLLGGSLYEKSRWRWSAAPVPLKRFDQSKAVTRWPRRRVRSHARNGQSIMWREYRDFKWYTSPCHVIVNFWQIFRRKCCFQQNIWRLFYSNMLVLINKIAFIWKDNLKHKN